MADTMVCHECGGRMARGAKPVEFEYKGQKIILEQPGWYCASCEESVLTGADMMATEPAFLEFKATVDGLAPPKEVSRIRKKLKLPQRKAGLILGGGVHAFQKYESGKDLPTKAMSNLLRLLDNQPALLEHLVAIQTRKENGKHTD
jgi:HTH-type transcriptional regulator / antitoxin MqsA